MAEIAYPDELASHTIKDHPFFVLLGPTAVGKTDVSIIVAEKIGAEIVSCDSVAVYRYLDIGSDKPAPEVRARIPHHMLDVVDPTEEYNVALYIRDADRSLEEIVRRKRPALLVGGTALYLSALLEGLDLPVSPPDHSLREALWAEAKEKGSRFLWERLIQVDAEAARRIHPQDTVRIVRALEVFYISGRPISSFWSGSFQRPQLKRYPQAVVVGLFCQRETLWRRLKDRLGRLLNKGWLEEIKSLLDKGYSPQLKSLRSLGYRELVPVVLGKWDLERGKAEYLRRAKDFARRQMTWFSKRSYIQWVDATSGNLKEMSDKVLMIFERGGHN